MKVIILSTSKYKEKDCIYNALSEQGPLSFKARGAQDSKSPFVWLNNVLTVADVELVEGRYKYPILNSATLISSSITGSDSLEYLYSINALASITKQMLDDDEKHLFYQDLLDATAALKKGKDPYMVILIYLARGTKYGGAELEVDKCIYSGSTSDIVAFSFSDGGFISRPYVTEETSLDLTPQQMKLIRYCYKAPDFSCVGAEQFSKQDKQVILNKLLEFIDEIIGAKLDSLQYLTK